MVNLPIKHENHEWWRSPGLSLFNINLPSAPACLTHLVSTANKYQHLFQMPLLSIIMKACTWFKTRCRWAEYICFTTTEILMASLFRQLWSAHTKSLAGLQESLRVTTGMCWGNLTVVNMSKAIGNGNRRHKRGIRSEKFQPLMRNRESWQCKKINKSPQTHVTDLLNMHLCRFFEAWSIRRWTQH